MNIWGAAIPGLAMNSRELPEVEGLARLQNPEVGLSMASIKDSYTLKDVAELHAKTICELAETSPSSSPFQVIGVSMGAMVAMLLASKFRARLPLRCHFRLLMPSANLPSTPALSPQRLSEWTNVDLGSVDDFERVLTPFFSPQFCASQPERVRSFAQYRARGDNGQSAGAFMRQAKALRSFDAQACIAAGLNQAEITFVYGAEDRIFDESHRKDLMELFPKAKHIVIPNLGHMVCLERPDLFERRPPVLFT